MIHYYKSIAKYPHTFYKVEPRMNMPDFVKFINLEELGCGWDSMEGEVEGIIYGCVPSTEKEWKEATEELKKRTNEFI